MVANKKSLTHNYQGKTAQELEALCSSDAKACYRLATMYANGNNVLYDRLKANMLFEKSCQKGYGDGCGAMGLIYYAADGAFGVKRDLVKSKMFFEKACQKNIGYGCSFLGVQYELGQGVSQDLAKAKELYGKACNLGDEVACRSY